MTDEIQELIRKSRKKGGFKKKGYFKLAHEKAKSKIGEYALPSSRYYCLELIQAAVAAGSVYIDVAVDDDKTITTFAGVWFDRKDLEMLFNFILTSREEAYYRTRRRLAIAIAAALSLSSKVIVETGDGTLKGSTRMELFDLKRDAVIGTPKKPIRGTFVRVNRGGGNEEHIIEERCLNIPTSLCLNDNLVTGFVGGRGIRIVGFGYRHGTRINEGDFYGGVAFNSNYPGKTAEFKILTNGVWITSIAFPELPDGMFGIVNFERLRKTANQYEIVRDERLGALVERLKPYIDRILFNLNVSVDKRLRYLCHRAPYDIFRGGDLVEITVREVPKVGSLKLDIFYDPEEAGGMRIFAEWDGRLVDAITLPFDFSCNVRMRLETLTIDSLHFRSFLKEAYDSNYVVALNSEIYEKVKQAVAGNREAIGRHLVMMRERHETELKEAAEQVDPARPPEELVLEKEEIITAAAGSPGLSLPVDPEVSAGELPLLRSEEERSPRLQTFPILSPDEIVSYMKSAEDTKKKYSMAAVVLGRILAPVLKLPYVEADDFTCSKKFSFKALDESIMVYGRVTSYLMDFHGSPVYCPHRSGETYNYRLPEKLLSLTQLPEFTININHPAIRRLLTEIQERPEAAYALAAIVLNELNHMTSYVLTDETLGFHLSIASSFLGLSDEDIGK